MTLSAIPSVRQATAADLPAIAPLFDAYRQFYEQPSDPDGALRFLRDNHAAGQSVIFFVQDENGQAAGFTQLYPTLSSVSMKRLWTLNDLYVDPTCRSRGAAQALLARAEQHARDTGAKGLQLSTAADNTRAQALYTLAGYVRDEVFYHYYRSVEAD